MSKSNVQALWYFESVNLYNILCPHKVKTMGATHEFKKCKRDQMIYRPDEPSQHIYMIAEGRVKIGHYLEDGKEVVKAILTKGEIFGELAVAGEENRADFAQAMDEGTSVCPMTIAELKDLMFEDKELSFRLLKLVGLRLMRMERKLELLVFKDARTRIIEFLKDSAAWKGKKVGFETMIPTKLTHKDIAALTGTSRQTVTTVLNELKEKNLINFDRKKILIRDLEKLA
ncbi:MAG: Crp/Fnr family transcriptional regulator [Cyclobacteriaceae bacterium]|jgi:CRP/FNR family cyclic AMP-dependent transcriptional regulator|nr:Crp/Fnr family transcriptional regulator [Flammeovirgaceae bacterium]MCZ8023073.1 Crp/Fnr family transcriptional regulator [Cytophagales bacterium]MCZ8326715.1 Crp/Fnr family transcriptional regulator [Cyclobacteriaceae bacterium]